MDPPGNWILIADRVSDFDIEDATLDRWNSWFKQFTIVLKANAWDRLPNSQRVALLMLKCKSLIPVFGILGIDDSNVEYDCLVDEIVQYLNPVNARIVLWSRKQNKNESFRSFAMALKSLSGPCQYGFMTKSIVRDVFISNMDIAHTDINLALRRKYDVSLEEAINFAEAMLSQNCFPSRSLEDSLCSSVSTSLSIKSAVWPQEPTVGPVNYLNIRMKPITPGIHEVKLIACGEGSVAYVCPKSMVNARQGFLDELNHVMKKHPGPEITPVKGNSYVAIINCEWVRVIVLSIEERKARVLAKDSGWTHLVAFSVIRNLPLDFIPIEPLLWTIDLQKERSQHLDIGAYINIKVIHSRNTWVATLVDPKPNNTIFSEASFGSAGSFDRRFGSDVDTTRRTHEESSSLRAGNLDLETFLPKEKDNCNLDCRARSEVRKSLEESPSSSCGSSGIEVEEDLDSPFSHPLPSTTDSDGSQRTLKYTDQSAVSNDRRFGGRRSGSDNQSKPQFQNNRNPVKNGSDQGHHGRGNKSRKDSKNACRDSDSDRSRGARGGDKSAVNRPFKSSSPRDNNHFDQGRDPQSALNNRNSGASQSKRDQEKSSFSKSEMLHHNGNTGNHQSESHPVKSSKSENNSRSAHNVSNTGGSQPKLVPRPVELANAANGHPAHPPVKYSKERTMPLKKSVPAVVLNITANKMFFTLKEIYNKFDDLYASICDEEKKDFTDPKLMDLCLVFDDGQQVARGEIIKISYNKQKAMVRLIDFGHEMTKPLSELMVLPERYWEVQPFAFGAKVTNDVEFDTGDTIYVTASSQEEDGTWVVKVDKSQPAPMVVPKQVVQPAKSSTFQRKVPSPLRPPHQPLIPRNTFSMVKVVHHGEEGSFCFPVGKIEILAGIQSQLTEKNLRPLQGLPQHGKLYAAPFEGDIFRARLLKVNPDNRSCRIVFVDFGNESEVPVNEMKSIPDDLQGNVFTFKFRLSSNSVKPAKLLEDGTDIEVTPIIMEEDGAWLLQLKGEPSKSLPYDDEVVEFS